MFVIYLPNDLVSQRGIERFLDEFPLAGIRYRADNVRVDLTDVPILIRWVAMESLTLLA